MGDSILFQESSELWAKKRKSLSVAFYKEKLMKMLEVVKKCMEDKILEWRKNFVSTGKPMDIIAEISKI